MAQEFALSFKITALDNATRPLGRINRALGRLSRPHRGLQRLGASMDRVSGAANTLGTTALTRITAPLVAGGGLALYAAGELEKLEVQMESLLGGTAEAKRMVSDLAEFTARTPFQLTEVGDAARQLLAAQVGADEVIDRLTLLGDTAAGAGKPINELAQIYSKAMNIGRVDTETLNQMAERGIPIYQTLMGLVSKRIGQDISKDDFRKGVEMGWVEPEMLTEALRVMTGAGGVYENQMEKQSKTIFGRFSTLKDNIFLLTAEIGQQLESTFSVKGNMMGLTDWIGGLTEDFRTFRDENPETADLLVKIAGGAALLGPGLIGLGIAFKGLSLGLSGLALVMNPLGLAIAGIAVAGGLLWYYWDDIGPAWDRGVANMKSKWDEFMAYVRGESDKTLGAIMSGEPHPNAVEAFEEVHGTPDPSAGEVTHQTFGGLIDAWNYTFAWIERNTPAKLQFLNRPISFEGIDAWGWLQRQWDELSFGNLSFSLPAPVADAWGWLQRQWDELSFGNLSFSLPAPVADAWSWLQRQWDELSFGNLSFSLPAPVADAWSWLQRQWDELSFGNLSFSLPAPVADAWGWLQRQWDELSFGNLSFSLPAPVADAWGWLQRQWDALSVGELKIEVPEIDLFGWIEEQWSRLWRSLAIQVRDILGDTATDFIFGDEFGLAMPAPLASNDNTLGRTLFQELQMAPPAPTIFGEGRSEGTASARDVLGRREDKVVIELDLGNLPKGTRVRTRGTPNPDIDIDVTAGYSMAGS